MPDETERKTGTEQPDPVRRCEACHKPLPEDAHGSRIYCYTCSVHARKGWRVRKPLRLRTCIECKKTYLAENNLTKRCNDCRQQRDEMWWLYTTIRSKLATLAITSPEEARDIVEQMLKEEGILATQEMLGTVLNMVLIDEREPNRKEHTEDAGRDREEATHA